MNAYEALSRRLEDERHTWLVTGVAGFIGSNLLERLLKLDQTVVGIDNFATGHRHNLDEVRTLVSPQQWARFRFEQADITRLDDCHAACQGVAFVLHQAALGSVPRSLADPLATHRANVDGFVNMLVAARDAKVKRIVYAASSSTYGDHPALPKVEDVIGRPLSPYAATKYINEVYADVFARCYGLSSIGLRYFNVFGPRQDPDGAYAAVIPRWLAAMAKGQAVTIHGDGETSRDFCFIDNAVQANLLAATIDGSNPGHQVFNIAVGEQTSLHQLFASLRDELHRWQPGLPSVEPQYRPFRTSDVRHSRADITRAASTLGYVPSHTFGVGLSVLVDWYTRRPTVSAPTP